MVVLGQYRSVLNDTWWCWLIYDGTGSVEGGTGRYLVEFGDSGSVWSGTVDTWWYWDIKRRYWMIYNSTGSVWSRTD